MLGWLVSVALVVVAVGCKSALVTPIPDTESRPEGVGRVVKVEPNEPVGVRLTLDSGVVLTLGPPGTRSEGDGERAGHPGRVRP